MVGSLPALSATWAGGNESGASGFADADTIVADGDAIGADGDTIGADGAVPSGDVRGGNGIATPFPAAWRRGERLQVLQRSDTVMDSWEDSAVVLCYLPEEERVLAPFPYDSPLVVAWEFVLARVRAALRLPACRMAVFRGGADFVSSTTYSSVSAARARALMYYKEPHTLRELDDDQLAAVCARFGVCDMLGPVNPMRATA